MSFLRKDEIHRAVTVFEDNLGSSERLLDVTRTALLLSSYGTISVCFGYCCFPLLSMNHVLVRGIMWP